MRAALLLLSNLLRLLLLPLWAFGRYQGRPTARFVKVRLHSHPIEVGDRTPWWQRWLRRHEPKSLRSIAELRELTALIAEDPRTDGLLLYVPHLAAGWATCTSLRQVILALRARGKRVVAYLPLGGSNRELYVAMAADRVLVSPQAPLSLIGLGSQVVYFKPLLDRIGVQVEVLARGEYKTAAEPYARETMSVPQREQLTRLLETLQTALAQALAARPGFDDARAALVFADGVWGTAAALTAGVIDGCCYEDQLSTELGLAFGDGSPFVAESAYLAFHRGRLWQPVRALPEIAIVPIRGTIVHGAPQLPSGRVATHADVTAALRLARKDKRVQAVVLYVDSPGGSALASDLIHREIIRLCEKKPVVAYLGDVAASGGYYVAAPCRRIVAQPTAVTGSIGVVSVRLLGSEIAQRIGLRPQTLVAAPHADMLSPFRPPDPHEQAMLEAETDSIYQAFVGIVAEGRQRTTPQIEEIARGRVWSGEDALRAGLIDELGGLERALSAAKELVPSLQGLPEAGYRVRILSKADADLPPAEPQAELRPGIPVEASNVLSLLQAGEHALLYAVLPDFR